MKLVVVGAGLSGLSAAVRLQRAGHEVMVIEASDRPGGRCKAIHRDGFLIDTCPELAATSYRRWLAFIDEMGLSGELVRCPTVVSMLKDGRLIDIDMGNLLSVALTPVLSWEAKLRFLVGMVKLRKQLKSVPHYLLDNIALDDPHSNAKKLSLESFGPEVTDKLVEPLLRPLGGVTLDMMSTMLLPYSLSDWKAMVTLRGGLDVLPKKAATTVPVTYKTKVKRVQSDDGGVRIECEDETGGAQTIRADKCLITTPYDQAEAIFPRLTEISNGYRQSMKFIRMVDIKLAYGKAPPSKAAMVMLSSKESSQVNVISLAHNKSPDRAPPGHALFSLFTEHNDYERLAAMSDETLIRLMRTQIETLYPDVKGTFLFSYVARQERVSYVPDAGFFHRTKQLWEAIGNEPRVHLGGDLFMFGGMEAAVASGERAAERLIQRA